MNTRKIVQYIYACIGISVVAILAYLLFTLIIPAWRDGAFSIRNSHEQSDDARTAEQVCDTDEAKGLIQQLRIPIDQVSLCSVETYMLSDSISSAKLVSLIFTTDGQQNAVSRVYFQNEWYPIRVVQPYHKIFVCESVLYDKPNGDSYTLLLLPGDGGFGWQWNFTDYRYQYSGTGVGNPQKQTACTIDGTLLYPYQQPIDDSELHYAFDVNQCRANGGTGCEATQATVENTINLCNSIDDPDQKDTCLSMFAIFHTQPALCSSLSTVERAGLCLTHIAIRQWDRELCDDIGDDTLKAECVALITTEE